MFTYAGVFHNVLFRDIDWEVSLVLSSRSVGVLDEPLVSVHLGDTKWVIIRGATQEFELRSIKFKKYISGLRSTFWFQKKHNFASKPHKRLKLCAKLQIFEMLAKLIFTSKSGVK